MPEDPISAVDMVAYALRAVVANLRDDLDVAAARLRVGEAMAVRYARLHGVPERLIAKSLGLAPESVGRADETWPINDEVQQFKSSLLDQFRAAASTASGWRDARESSSIGAGSELIMEAHGIPRSEATDGAGTYGQEWRNLTGRAVLVYAPERLPRQRDQTVDVTGRFVVAECPGIAPLGTCSGSHRIVTAAELGLSPGDIEFGNVAEVLPPNGPTVMFHREEWSAFKSARAAARLHFRIPAID